MAEILKPTSLNAIWAEVGQRVRPAEAKIQQGWEIEIPTHQHENWLAHRQDTAIAHFNQRGVPEWDSVTSYLGGKSYVQGSDGKVYRAIIDNQNVDPTSGSSAWISAFIAADDLVALKLFNGYQVISSDLHLTVNNRYYAIGNVTVTIPNTAARGDNVVLNKLHNVEVEVVVDGGGRIGTAAGAMDSVIYDIYDELNVTYDGSRWQTS